MAAPEAKSQTQDKCLKAADYKGCMEYYSDVNSSSREIESGAEPGTVDVSQPNPYNYNPASVMQLKIRGSYGRYITFIGKTVNEYAGTSGYSNPGSPGTVNCYTTGGYGGISGYTTCQRTGYVAPSYVPGTPGGVQNRSYRYELDCHDMTFDRKGDYAGGISNKGWMNVDSDPTAQAVANKYCSIIDDLPKRPDWKAYGPIEVDWDNWKAEGDRYVAKAINAKGEWLYLAVSCDKRLINATGSDGNWKAWNAPSLKFEKALIKDLC